MKSFNKFLLMSAALLSMSLTSCGGNGPSKDPNEVSVFLLSGQSNMEGNSKFAELGNAFTELGLDDYEEVSQGFDTVKISNYSCGYGELNKDNLTNNSNVKATNTTNQIAGKFENMKPGYGTNAQSMGPEFGAAYVLRKEATSERPIYFVKMASNGSGFAQSGTQYNWPVKDADGNFPEVNLYNTFAKPFLENNLKILEDQGLKPVIKGWLWHQGESDSATEKIAVYGQRLGDMVAQFREDFADYARDGDGENIAFIDGMIYQGEGTSWGAETSVAMNNAKKAFANSADNNYLVDNYANEEKTAENELKPGSPGGDSMHYNIKSCMRLGMAYGRVILDNDLLD